MYLSLLSIAYAAVHHIRTRNKCVYYPVPIIFTGLVATFCAYVHILIDSNLSCLPSQTLVVKEDVRATAGVASGDIIRQHLRHDIVQRHGETRFPIDNYHVHWPMRHDAHPRDSFSLGNDTQEKELSKSERQNELPLREWHEYSFWDDRRPFSAQHEFEDPVPSRSLHSKCSA